MNWIKLWNIPEGHWLNSDLKYYAAWIKLIQMAEYKDGTKVIRGTMIETKRGSVYTSVNKLAKAFGISRYLVEHFLAMCEADSMIDLQRISNRYIVIKVNNYAKFQDKPKGRFTTDLATDCATDCTTERVFFLTNKQNIQKDRRKNGFADFPQRDTDYDALLEEVK